MGHQIETDTSDASTKTDSTGSSTTGATRSVKDTATTNSVNPTMPTPNAPAGFSPPGTLSVSATDMLAEQVELNAQLRLVDLQGGEQ